MRISCFNTQLLGTSKTRSDVEQFVLDEQLDVLFITETWWRCQGGEAKCVDMMPPGYGMRSFPHSKRGGGLAFIVRDAVFDHATVTASFPFSHSSFRLAQLSPHRNSFTSSACIDLPQRKTD